MVDRDSAGDPGNKTGDLAFGAFYSAGVGGSVVALFFAALDLVAGRGLLTPSLLGAVLFFDAPADTFNQVDLTAVALFSIVHFIAFGILGAFASAVYQRVALRGGPAELVSAVAIFLLAEIGILIGSATFMPGVVDRLGHVPVIVANVLAALSMTALLYWGYRQSPSPREEASGSQDAEHDRKLRTL